MPKNQEKEALCAQHRALLYIILHFGHGAMLLPQLRALCLVLGLYTSTQAVNRAVRALKAADILTRQTWVDNNSDLLLARKYVYRFFLDRTSQEVATPRRPGTMAPYIAQARKVDWLVSIVEQNNVGSIGEAEELLRSLGSTMFLRLPDLAGYYLDNAPILNHDQPDNFQYQLNQLEASNIQRRTMASRDPFGVTVPPITTLEQAHRRELYIARIDQAKRQVYLALFAGRETKARRVMDWLIDAHLWVISLLPDYDTALWVYALDSSHKAALSASLKAIAPGTMATPYWQYRLEQQKIFGRAHLAVGNSDFVRKWCGGISALTTI